jgi:hypothetical protein
LAQNSVPADKVNLSDLKEFGKKLENVFLTTGMIALYKFNIIQPFRKVNGHKDIANKEPQKSGTIARSQRKRKLTRLDVNFVSYSLKSSKLLQRIALSCISIEEYTVRFDSMSLKKIQF